MAQFFTILNYTTISNVSELVSTIPISGFSGLKIVRDLGIVISFCMLSTLHDFILYISSSWALFYMDMYNNYLHLI